LYKYTFQVKGDADPFIKGLKDWRNKHPSIKLDSLEQLKGKGGPEDGTTTDLDIPTAAQVALALADLRSLNGDNCENAKECYKLYGELLLNPEEGKLLEVCAEANSLNFAKARALNNTLTGKSLRERGATQIAANQYIVCSLATDAAFTLYSEYAREFLDKRGARTGKRNKYLDVANWAVDVEGTARIRDIVLRKFVFEAPLPCSPSFGLGYLGYRFAKDVLIHQGLNRFVPNPIKRANLARKLESPIDYGEKIGTLFFMMFNPTLIGTPGLASSAVNLPIRIYTSITGKEVDPRTRALGNTLQKVARTFVPIGFFNSNFNKIRHVAGGLLKVAPAATPLLGGALFGAYMVRQVGSHVKERAACAIEHALSLLESGKRDQAEDFLKEVRLWNFCDQNAVEAFSKCIPFIDRVHSLTSSEEDKLET
jgi:hypothetical protein